MIFVVLAVAGISVGAVFWLGYLCGCAHTERRVLESVTRPSRF